MSRRTLKHLVVLLLLALVAGACGARVSEQQLRAAGGPSGAVGVGSGTAGGDAALGTGDGGAGTSGAGTGSGGDVGGDAGTGGDGSTGGADPATAGGGEAAAPAAPAEGNGGATDVGVTANEILLGNVSTLSGPVPGLFQGAVLGAQAVVAYQNSKGGLVGRQIKLDARDDQFDTGQNRAQTVELAGKAFAFLGSFSLFDDAGVEAMRKSGIPDFSVPLSDTRGKLATNASVAPFDLTGAPTGPFLWFKSKFPEAVTKMGTIWGDIPTSKASHLRFKAAAESVGWNYVYDRGFQATETDFTADVVRMRQSGVRGVFMPAADNKTVARVARAMAQQGFKPDFFVANYDPQLMALGGEAVEGMYSHTPFSLFGGEDSAVNPEVKLFNDWFKRVRPNGKPDLFAVYSWAQGRLLFQLLEELGPKVTRAGLVEAMRKVDTFSANDIIAPAGPGPKTPATCYLIAQIKGGAYKRIDPAKGYRCDGTYFRR